MWVMHTFNGFTEWLTFCYLSISLHTCLTSLNRVVFSVTDRVPSVSLPDTLFNWLLSKVTNPDPHGYAISFKVGSRSALEWKAGSGSALNSKFRIFRVSKCSHWGLSTLIKEVWRLEIGFWRVCRPAVANSPNFDEEQDPDRIRIKAKNWIRLRISIKGKSWIRISIKGKRWIQIRIEFMRIRNPSVLLWQRKIFRTLVQNSSVCRGTIVSCSVVDPDPDPGSGSVLDPYSIGPLDPDPDP
jgi:hypothetical protein